MAEEEKVDELDLHDPPLPKGTEVQPLSESKTSQVAVRSGLESPIPAGPDITMTQVLAMLVQKEGADIEVLKAMVALKKELDHDAAMKKFNAAFSKVQKNLEPVIARKSNTHTKSKYAGLEDINRMINPIAATQGFSISFRQAESSIENYIRIVGDLSHKDGGSKEYFIDLPRDEKGSQGTTNKTVVHAIGSTFSYGQRYLLKLMFNIAIIGEDDDGVAAGGKVADDTITEEQAKELNTLIGGNLERLKTVLTTYNEQYPVKFLADLKTKDFQNCKNRLVKYNEAHK